MDPFERAEYEGMDYDHCMSITSSCWRPPPPTSLNGCKSFRQFPQHQKPGSFNLDRIMESITSGAAQNGGN